jgi:hypothetical protein
MKSLSERYGWSSKKTRWMGFIGAFVVVLVVNVAFNLTGHPNAFG